VLLQDPVVNARAGSLLALAATLGACASPADTAAPGAPRELAPSARPAASKPIEPAPPVRLLDGIAGAFQRPGVSASPEAQRFFDQGLTLCWGFNHGEAIRSFQRALELDPKCAMAWWGIALAHGPNFNRRMEASSAAPAFEAIARARALAEAALPSELSAADRDLIAALAARYASPAPADRKPLDEAWAAAMRDVRARHPDDPDVGALFAESLLDLRPWDQWTKEGVAQPGTEEAIAVLEQVLARVPDHPGALHYLIHALEASPKPERALAAADRLRGRVPGSGHLQHMPSHIDMRVGRYAEAIATNERAIAADQRYVARAGRSRDYALYHAHDQHLLAWASMWDGQSLRAIAAARDLARELPLEYAESLPDMGQRLLSTPYDALVRFGRWDEILVEPPPATSLPAVTAYWRYSRTMALSALGRLEEATRERAELDAAAAKSEKSDTLAIALALADGELAYRRGEFDAAFAKLREAVALDDGLKYREPWRWMQPVRHSLGALLLEQGRVEEAEAVYREDLERHPENGWSLHGLAECLRKRGANDEAAQVQARFEKAWARADVELPGSCFCRTRSGGTAGS
jgi:tetratricopeptide (TPR) repeat protein